MEKPPIKNPVLVEHFENKPRNPSKCVVFALRKIKPAPEKDTESYRHH